MFRRLTPPTQVGAVAKDGRVFRPAARRTAEVWHGHDDEHARCDDAFCASGSTDCVQWRTCGKSHPALRQSGMHGTLSDLPAGRHCWFSTLAHGLFSRLASLEAQATNVPDPCGRFLNAQTRRRRGPSCRRSTACSPLPSRCENYLTIAARLLPILSLPHRETSL